MGESCLSPLFGLTPNWRFSSLKEIVQNLWGIYTEIDERARPRLEPLPTASFAVLQRKIPIGRGLCLEPHPTGLWPAISTLWRLRWGSNCSLRSQQGLSPTEGALELTPYAESLEANTAAILRNASGLGKALKGTVRISASEIMVASRYCPPMLAELRRRHPGFGVRTGPLSNTVDNLLRRDADIAVRMVEPAQEAGGQEAGHGQLGPSCAQGPISSVPARQPDSMDLAEHSLIGFDRRRRLLSAPWAAACLVPIPSAFRFRADSDIAQLRAIRAGASRHRCLPEWGLAKQNPDLVRLLPEAFELKLSPPRHA